MLTPIGQLPPVEAAVPVQFTWPPTLDTKNTVTQSVDDRTIERFVHGPRDAWGYPANTPWGYPVAQETGFAQQNYNSFYLVSPKVPRDHAPLCVVLHSANRTAYDYLGFGSLNRKIEAADDPSSVMTKSPDDFYALYLNSTNVEFWGWDQIVRSHDYAQNVNTAPPAERRVLDTIEWVVQRYKIDRNRIYLCGASLGGCGALGIGMPHGNIFAALRVSVPGGTGYASYRMGGFSPIPTPDAPPAEVDAWKKRAAGTGLPDPPVICVFSAMNDPWAITQPPLVYAARYGHLPLILTWGMFGHTPFANRISARPICQIGLAFPWLEIRRNEAYPVFTRATSNQRVPWLDAPVEFDWDGQMNAYFRWKNVDDTSAHFAMQLWIDHPNVPGPALATPGNPALPPVVMPDKATAHITLRRLQQFKVQPGTNYAWKVSSGNSLVASGNVTSDASNLLTIPKVPLTTAPVELSLQGP